MKQMKKAKTFELFEKAYEKGLRGEVESFHVWLRARKIEPALFDANQIGKFLLENSAATTDREAELQTIAEFVGFFEKEREGLYHLAVVGVRGSGKSHLLHAVGVSLQEIGTKLKLRLIDATKFSQVEEGEEEQQYFYKFLDELKTEHYNVLLIDSCEHDKNIEQSLKEIIRILKEGVLLTAWTPQFWDHVRERMEDIVPTAKEVELTPLSKQNTLRLVQTIREYTSKGSHKTSQQVCERIYGYSRGIPGTIISLLYQAFYESFLKHKKDVDVMSVDEAAEVLGIKGIPEKLKDLADHQVLMLKHILLNHDERGTRPTSLVEILGKDKATISYHLGTLYSEKLVVVEKVGRSSFYRVRPEIEPFVELRVAKEGEFLA